LIMFLRQGWQFALKAAPTATSIFVLVSMSVLPPFSSTSSLGGEKIYKIFLTSTSQKEGEHHFEG
jgi:hypothetical protein